MKKNQITNLSLLFIVLLSFSISGNAQHWSVTNLAGNGGSTFDPDVTTPLGSGMLLPGPITKDSENNIYFTAINSFGTPTDGAIYKLSADYSILEEILTDVYSLSGIAIDKNGNIYFSKGDSDPDAYNLEFIWVIPAGGSTPIPFAGNGYDNVDFPIYPESGDIANEVPIGNAGSLKVIADEDGNEFLYYSATLQDNNFIQKINISTGITYRVAGIPHTFDAGTYDEIEDGTVAIGAKLSMTLGLGSDSKGNIYYLTAAEGEDAYSIKKIVDGKIYHVAGTGESDYGGDGGPAKDATLATNNCGFTIENDTLYLCDLGNFRIRKFGLSTTSEPDGIITTICGTGFNEGDGVPAEDLSDNEIQNGTNTNMKPIDLISVDGDFIMTDLNSRIRKMFWCTNPVPGPITASSDVLCQGDLLQLSFDGEINGGAFWRWYEGTCSEDESFIGSGPTLDITLSENTSYFVIGMGGCTHNAVCEELVIELNCQNFYNAITPNSDGLNDFVDMPALGNYPINTVTFYNRWGDILEVKENYNNSTVVWSGTNGDGDPVDSGTYFFTAESGGELIISGWIQVIREQ